MSLKSCLAAAGKSISPADAQRMTEAAGEAGQAAEIAAVDAAIAEAEADLRLVLRKIGERGVRLELTTAEATTTEEAPAPEATDEATTPTTTPTEKAAPEKAQPRYRGEQVIERTLPVGRKGWKGSPLANYAVYRQADGTFKADAAVWGTRGGFGGDLAEAFKTQAEAERAALAKIEEKSQDGIKAGLGDSLNTQERADLTKWLADERTRLDAEGKAPAPKPLTAREKQRIARELERELHTSMSASADMLGKTEAELSALIAAKVAATPNAELVNESRIAQLAKSIHKALAKAAKEIEKQKHRDPAVLRETMDSAMRAHNITDANAQAQYAVGFQHAMAGKTKSTLVGDRLPEMLKGYEDAMAWRETEEGRAFYEGRPAKKLQNTGVDLKRWFDAAREDARAMRKPIEKTAEEVLRRTTRGDFFDSVLSRKDLTPGMRLYAERIRAGVRPFKDWLQKDHTWTGWYRKTDEFWKSAILEGSDRPTSVKRESWDDDAERTEWLLDQAERYIAQVSGLVSNVFDGKNTVAETAEAYDTTYLKPLSEDSLTRLSKGQYIYESREIKLTGEALKAFRSLWLNQFKRSWQNMGLDDRAVRHLIEHEQSVKIPTKAQPLTPPKLDRVERTGRTDHRKGQNVTPAQVKETFGFADIGFGKWVGSRQDQDHLNYAFDAFMDLAEHFGMDPKNIGFGGKLHLTIGALGHGKYAAHFSPGQPSPNGPVPVINVTNTRGDGTVYHEWMHALDHFLFDGLNREDEGSSRHSVRRALIRVLQKKHLTAKDYEREADKFLYGNWYFKGSKSLTKSDEGRLQNAIRGVDYLRGHPGSSEYKVNSDKLSTDYWGTSWEMLARATEAWAVDTLGGVNNYLANPAWAGEGMASPERGHRGTPYPTGYERKLINMALTAFAKSVKWDNGVPSVELGAFERAPPDEFREGEERYRELSTIEGMRAYVEQKVAALEAAQAAEAEEVERAAQAKLAELEALQTPTAPAPQPSDAMGKLTEQEYLDLAMQAAAELREERQEQPAAPIPGEPAQVDYEPEKPATARGPRAKPERTAKEPAPKDTTPQQRSASALAQEAAKLGVQGVGEAFLGLANLFGAGRIQSFPAGFDAEAYAKAKPHFQAALKAFQEAGRTLKDLFKLLISHFGDGIIPYAVQFAKESKLTNTLGEGTVDESPTSKLANALIAGNLIGRGTALDSRLLFRMADEAYGGTQAEGKYTPKDAYDAVELAVNRFLLRNPRLFNPATTPENARIAVETLQNLTQNLPTQTKRTEEQDAFQQFSTPPVLAYLANWVANVSEADTMMEPSAGIGGIATFAHNAGARLILNELNARRAAILQDLFRESKIWTEDAEQINNILPDDVVPSVVVMNPPFSSSGTRGVRKDTMIGARHVEQALLKLAPGGRLVAIVGDNMTGPAFKGWWDKIKAQYSVRAIVSADGRGYAKYGTTFDNALLVIDKVKPSETVSPVVARVEAYNALIGLLAGVRNERPSAEVPSSDRGAIERDAVEQTDSVDVQPGGGITGTGTAPGVTGVPGAESGRGGKSGVGGTGAGRGGRGGTRRPGGAVSEPGTGAGTGAGEDAGRGGAGDQGAAAGPVSAEGSGVTLEAADTAAGDLTDSVFEDYQPQRLKVDGAKPHPGPLVQSAAMASVLPPAPTYTPNLPEDTVKKGLLSLAQIEAIVYAGQAHQQILPNEQRRGFFIGDGTGVGKGREIAGIILDNQRQGRKKAVWVSEKWGLLKDAQRDLEGVGGDPKTIFRHKDAKAPVEAQEGVFFTTYSTLRSGIETAAAKKKKAQPKQPKVGDTITVVKPTGERVTGKVLEAGRQSTVMELPNGNRLHVFNTAIEQKAETETKGTPSRVDQLVSWLGPDFDGVIVFDEAHNAGNAEATKGERGPTDASAQGQAVVQLQEKLPKARIVYVSATGATEAENLAFATRLGMWGPGTPFASVKDFISEITAGGLSTMELVARDLKQMGAYIARSLSFDGVSYSRLEHELTPIQTDIYNRLADAWQVVLQNIEKALQVTGATNDAGKEKKGSKAAAAARSAFWGAQQRFFNQIITAMQMPAVVAQVERDLANGDAVVMQLVNTNEAAMERAKAAAAEEGEEGLEDLDLTPRQQLLQLVEKVFPTDQMEDYIDDGGKKATRPVLDSKGNRVQNKEAVAMRDKLLQDLKDIKVPDGPLEILINHFGPQVVAEITGRKERVVKHGDAPARTERRGKAAIESDARSFMDDKKRILVFSDAGGTGFSFHADRTQKNQRKRKHYLLQAGWRANKAVQGFGRSHRTNQASAPHYYLVTTNIPAQKRFLSAIARRLDQLGALTKGQRDTANQGLFSEKDNLESKYATQAVSQFFTDLQNGAIEQNEPYDVGDSVTWSNTAGDEASGEVISDEGGQFVKVKVTKVPQGYERYIGHEQRVVRAQIRGYEKRNRGINFTEFMQQMGLTGILDQATGKIPDTKMPPTRQFLNRMLSLKLDMQEKAFAAFIERMEQKIETAIERGELDTGMETIRALSSRVVDEETIYTDARTGAETKLVELELEHPTRYYDFPDAKLYGDRPIEWVVNRRSGKVWGRVKAGTNSTDAKGNVVERYRLFSTSGNKVKNASEPDMTPNGFEATYSKIDEAKARELWADENAKREPTYKDTTYLITGAVLPIWDRLKGGENSTLRVARTQTVDGRRWLGRVVEAKDIGEIRQRFNVKGPAAKLAPLDVMKRILAGEEAKLSNGWKLVRSRVADDLRIELKTPQALYGPARTELEGMGFFSERISWQDRHFLPTGPAGVEALTKLIASNKQIVDLAKPGDTKGQFSTGTAPATGIPQAALASLVARAQDRLRGIQIRIVESPDRLPAEAQKDQKVNRAVAWTDGNGTVYLVRNMIDSPKEAAEAIVHEVIGHEGVNAITSPEEWRVIEESLWRWLDRTDLAPSVAAAVASVRSRYADAIDSGDRATFARELLAVMAEKGVKTGLMDRVLTALRRFLRSLLPDLAFSEAEARALLARAARAVTKPGPRGPGGGAFKLAPDDPAELAAWLADSKVKYVVYHGSLSDFRDFDPDRRGERTFATSAKQGFFFTDDPYIAATYGSESVSRTVRARDALTAARNELGSLTGEIFEHHVRAQLRDGAYDADPAKKKRIVRNLKRVDAAMRVIDGHDDPYTQNPRLAKRDGRLYKAYLRITNPLVVENEDMYGERRFSKAIEDAIAKGHDGVIFRNTYDPALEGGPADPWGNDRRVGYMVNDDDRHDVYVVFDNEQIRLAGEPIRGGGQFSAKAAPAIVDRLEQAITKGPSTLVEKMRTTALHDWRPTWLGALMLRHLGELSKGTLGGVGSYVDRVQRMATDRNVMQEEADDLAERWRKWAQKNRREGAELADLMHDTTIVGVDPSKAYEPLRDEKTAGPGIAGEAITPAYVKGKVRALEQQMAVRRRAEGALGSRAANQRDFAEIQRLEGLLKAEQARVAAYGPLVARFTAQPEEGQAIYRDVRDLYLKRSDQTLKALEERVNESTLSGSAREKAIAELRRRFEAARVQGPYFPLARFGDYWISAERPGKGDEPDTVREFFMYENAAEWQKGKKDLAAQGYRVTNANRRIETARAVDGASQGFVAELLDVLKEGNVGAKVQDDVYQLYLRTVPDLSVRKHFIHRQKVAGYSADALRAFAGNMNHTAHQLARLRHGHRLEREMVQMRDEVSELGRMSKEGERTLRATALYNEMQKRHEWVMNPRDSAATNKISSLGFMWYLGLTPAAALVNLTQTPIVTFPVLAAKFGGRAAGVLTTAMKQAMSTYGHIEKYLTDEEKQAYGAWQASGALDKTQSHNLAGIAEGGTHGYTDSASRFMRTISHLFHKAEVINREATGVAAFRLARASGMSFPDAVKYAEDVIFESHFDYSNANRARFMQSGAAKVLLMFRQYSLAMSWFLWRNFYQSMKGATPEEKTEARRKLTGVLGMTGLFAGVMGMPLMSVLFGIANAAKSMFGDDDEPWDAETEFRNFLADMLGTDAARIITNGPVESLTGAELGNRVSLDQLWLRDPDRELEGQALADYWLEQAAGPMGAVFTNALRAKSQMDDGHLLRGIETAMPKVLKDGMRALRYATEGSNNLRGDPMVDDLSLPEAALQLAGFSPARVAERYDANNAVKGYEQQVLQRRQSILDAYAMAVRLHNTDEIRAAAQRVGEWNRKHPEIPIDGATIRRSLVARDRYTRQAEGGIVVNRKLQGLRDAGRFAE